MSINTSHDILLILRLENNRYSASGANISRLKSAIDEQRNRISEVKLSVTLDKPVSQPVYYGHRRRQATVATVYDINTV